jgi:hypothetical protein
MLKNLIGPIMLLILASLILGCNGNNISTPKLDNPVPQSASAPSSSHNQLWGYNLMSALH